MRTKTLALELAAMGSIFIATRAVLYLFMRFKVESWSVPLAIFNVDARPILGQFL